MLHELGVTLQSRSSLQKVVLPAIYDTILDIQREQLSKADSVSVSFDGWKKGGNLHVLGQVYTYITSDWNYCNDLVRIIPVVGSPTAVHLQTLVQLGLKQLVSQDTLVVACVTDNESSYHLAAHHMADSIGCACHTLELCVEDLCWKMDETSKNILQQVFMYLPINYNNINVGANHCELYLRITSFDWQAAFTTRR